NPQSAQAARDVLVSLERVARAYSRLPGREGVGLEFQQRSLQLALQLRDRNPSSWFYQRTAAVSCFLTYQIAQAAGDHELANRCLIGSFSILDALVQSGIEIDEGMRQLHAQLAQVFKRA
ncbi:MAG TPA: hypothetical protein PKA37_18715, partial [Planctomycetota bacterium]|nr:hypothetical protein [Planctomycetota bacterium]